MRYFCEEVMAAQTARTMGLNRKTVNRYCKPLVKRLIGITGCFGR